MAIKWTIQGLLIYAAIGVYLAAFVTRILGQRKVGDILYFGGFAAALGALVYRWYDVQHIPMQNLFEVFLTMGFMIWPISSFCQRVLGVGGRAADMVIGAMVLFPAGFVFSAAPQKLPPALQCWLFGPHVAVYMLSYMVMAKASFQAIVQLSGRQSDGAEGIVDAEQGTYLMVRGGFVLLTLGLILGSWWGKLAWGSYWGWDPKESWSLASWLVYVGYFHFRYMFGRRHARLNSVWALLGMAVILTTLLWANLSRLFPGLHSYAT